MMGSTGTLAHSESSDVDLWLCVDPELEEGELALLSEKAKKIDDWANGLGLELHTFLMNAERFRKEQVDNRMDKESSGSAQHYLLLDEFYRTAILLAGRYPVWWLIPPDLEGDYQGKVELLLGKRFVKRQEVIDFGSAADIPKSELIGAGLWQLYKGLDSPYKSVLKILLAEVYAQELPEAETLSQVFKRAVYDDELGIENLDPYFLVYQRLESYLGRRREHKRLDIVQKSFYLKVAKKLSRSPAGRSPSWQRKLLEKIVRNWGWSDKKFRYLDSRSTWKVDEVMIERQALVAELSYCYRFLSQYSRAHGIRSSITAEDLNLLGRKLYANFQKKAGKIERVNPGIVGSLWEENLAIHHTSSSVIPSEHSGWLLYRDLGIDSDVSFEVALKKASSIIELLAWLYFNGIVSNETRLSFVPGRTGYRLQELQNMIRALQQTVDIPLPAVKQESYVNAAQTVQIILFVNVGVDPMEALAESGMQRLSERTDVLDYSTDRVSLVRTVDQISINNWNEVSAYRYEVGDTLMQTLQSYLQMCQAQLGDMDCQLSVYCFCPQRANIISKRVEEVFLGIKAAFFKGDEIISVRYVLDMGGRHYIVQFVDDQFRYFSYASESELYGALAQGPNSFSPIIFDEFAQTTETLVSTILPYNLPGQIQMFFYQHHETFQLIALDEYGSLLRLVLNGRDEMLLLSVLNECLQRMLETRQLSDMSSSGSQIPQVSFNKLSRVKDGSYRVRGVREIPHLAVNEVQLHVTNEGFRSSCDLSFQGVDFTYAEYGDQQYEALIHFARQHGVSDRLPFAISDVSITNGSSHFSISSEYSAKTMDTLRWFAKADKALNRASQKYKTV
jgi:adenylate cyclase class 1